MKIFGFIKNVINSLYISLKRYPLPIVFSILTTIIFIILSHHKLDMTKTANDNLMRGAMVLAIGIPLTLCINHIYERNCNIKLINKIITYTFVVAILILYYFFLLGTFEMVSITRYTAFSIALYLIFIFIPYYFKKPGFELYVVKLLSRFFVTVLYGIVLFLGITAILFTIDRLLKINVSSKTYYDVFLIIIGVFSPCYFLGGIPLNNTELTMSDYPKLLKILLVYIIMPLLTAYTIILYIYFGKIIFTLQWPIQLVMHLVLWYSLISTIVIFLTSILVIEISWVKFYNKWYTKILLPLLIMLFVSVGKRVTSYGITEPRYFVIVLGLWVLGIMLYLNLGKKPRNIVLPITFAIITILSVVGPFNAYSVSKYSQNHRLESILSKYHMLKDNNIIKPKKEISVYDKGEINQIMSYFSNFHKLSDVKFIPKNFKLSEMEKIFGFASQFDLYNANQNKYFSYNIEPQVNQITITGYDYFIIMNGGEFTKLSNDNKLKITYDNQSYVMNIKYNDQSLGNISFQNYGRLLNKKLGNDSKRIISAADMTFNKEDSKLKAEVIFTSVSGHNDYQTNEVKIDYMNFYFLIKIK